MAPPLTAQTACAVWFGFMKYCFEAYVSTTWATEQIFKVFILP